MGQSRSELVSADIHWLVTLWLRGKRYQFSDQTVEVDNKNDKSIPKTLRYIAGLRPFDVADEIAMMEQGVSGLTIAISVLFADDNGGGWAAIAEADQDLGDSTAEIALWREGDDWKDRRVLVDGRVLQPVHGAESEPVDMSVSEAPWTDSGKMPVDSMVVSEDTWDAGAFHIDETILGQGYLIVYGSPGISLATDSVSEIIAMPALLVSVRDAQKNNYTAPATAVKLLLEGHSGAAEGKPVRIFNVDADLTVSPGTSMVRGGGYAAVTTVVDKDLLGRAVVTVQVADTDIYVDEGDELWWSALAIDDGGVWDQGRNRAMRGAGDIIMDLLGQSTIRIDSARMESVIPLLNRFRLDFFINEQITPWDFIQDQILPILPISPRVSDRGLYFVYWRYDAEIEDATAAINTSTRGGSRSSTVTVSSQDDIANYLRIDYAIDQQRGSHSRTLIYGPVDDGTPGLQVHPSAFASYTRYGVRQAETLTTSIVYDPQTAGLILDGLLSRLSVTYRTAEFLLPQEYQSINPGDVVVVTDSSISWDEVVCLATGVRRAPGDTLITVQTIPDWIRDSTP